jgi:hypothetical protein
MKRIIYLSLLFICTNSFAQTVTIPDVNFFNALKAAGVDQNNDNQIQTSEAAGVTKLILHGKSISDLTGIEAFTALHYLSCETNQLSSLNITANTLLDTLLCNDNQITSLNLSANTVLKKINCGSNLFITLDLSANTELRWLDCKSKSISSINVTNSTQLSYLDIGYTSLQTVDLSNNAALETLLCILDTSLISLDVSRNVILNSLNASLCKNLHHICVNPNQMGTKVSSWTKDTTCSWDTSCSTLGIEELQAYNTHHIITHIYDILGNELNSIADYKGIIIYQYEDGSTKKVLRID